MRTLESLINETLEGNLRAFGYVVGRFHGMAVGYAFSILNDFHLAEDAAQESFIQAFQRLDQLETPAAFPGWLKRIVFTRCDRMTRNKSISIVPFDLADQIIDASESPVTRLERKELESDVREAISQLAEAQRIAFSLFYISGHSIREIAEFLEVKESTIKSRLHAARVTMRSVISERFEELMPESQATDPYRETKQMFTKMYPELHVTDVEKAAHFFTDALGFKIGFKFEDEGVLDFAVLRHGDLMLYLHHMLPDDESDQPKRMRLYFEPQDIFELHAELKKKGYQVSDLVDETYGAGAKSCLLMGPDEYEFRFHQWKKD